jgi:hypothetical protein
MTRLAAVLLLASLAAIPGCVIGRYTEGEAIAVDQIPRIVLGETTKTEILDWFGSPQSFTEANFIEKFLSDENLSPGEITNLPYADVFVYRLTKGRLRGYVLVLFNHIRLDVASDTLVVFFDEEDRVLYYGWRKGTDVLD